MVDYSKSLLTDFNIYIGYFGLMKLAVQWGKSRKLKSDKRLLKS